MGITRIVACISCGEDPRLCQCTKNLINALDKAGPRQEQYEKLVLMLKNNDDSDEKSSLILKTFVRLGLKEPPRNIRCFKGLLDLLSMAHRQLHYRPVTSRSAEQRLCRSWNLTTRRRGRLYLTEAGQSMWKKVRTWRIKVLHEVLKFPKHLMHLGNILEELHLPTELRNFKKISKVYDLFCSDDGILSTTRILNSDEIKYLESGSSQKIRFSAHNIIDKNMKMLGFIVKKSDGSHAISYPPPDETAEKELLKDWVSLSQNIKLNLEDILPSSTEFFVSMGIAEVEDNGIVYLPLWKLSPKVLEDIGLRKKNSISDLSLSSITAPDIDGLYFLSKTYAGKVYSEVVVDDESMPFWKLANTVGLTSGTSFRFKSRTFREWWGIIQEGSNPRIRPGLLSFFMKCKKFDGKWREANPVVEWFAHHKENPGGMGTLCISLLGWFCKNGQTMGVHEIEATIIRLGVTTGITMYYDLQSRRYKMCQLRHRKLIPLMIACWVKSGFCKLEENKYEAPSIRPAIEFKDTIPVAIPSSFVSKEMTRENLEMEIQKLVDLQVLGRSGRKLEILAKSENYIVKKISEGHDTTDKLHNLIATKSFARKALTFEERRSLSNKMVEELNIRFVDNKQLIGETKFISFKPGNLSKNFNCLTTTLAGNSTPLCAGMPCTVNPGSISYPPVMIPSSVVLNSVPRELIVMAGMSLIIGPYGVAQAEGGTLAGLIPANGCQPAVCIPIDRGRTIGSRNLKISASASSHDPVTSSHHLTHISNSVCTLNDPLRQKIGGMTNADKVVAANILAKRIEAEEHLKLPETASGNLACLAPLVMSILDRPIDNWRLVDVSSVFGGRETFDSLMSQLNMMGLEPREEFNSIKPCSYSLSWKFFEGKPQKGSRVISLPSLVCTGRPYLSGRESTVRTMGGRFHLYCPEMAFKVEMNGPDILRKHFTIWDKAPDLRLLLASLFSGGGFSSDTGPFLGFPVISELSMAAAQHFFERKAVPRGAHPEPKRFQDRAHFIRRTMKSDSIPFIPQSVDLGRENIPPHLPFIPEKAETFLEDLVHEAHEMVKKKPSLVDEYIRKTKEGGGVHPIRRQLSFEEDPILIVESAYEDRRADYFMDNPWPPGPALGLWRQKDDKGKNIPIVCNEIGCYASLCKCVKYPAYKGMTNFGNVDVIASVVHRKSNLNILPPIIWGGKVFFGGWTTKHLEEVFPYPHFPSYEASGTPDYATKNTCEYKEMNHPGDSSFANDSNTLLEAAAACLLDPSRLHWKFTEKGLLFDTFKRSLLPVIRAHPLLEPLFKAAYIRLVLAVKMSRKIGSGGIRLTRPSNILIKMSGFTNNRDKMKKLSLNLHRGFLASKTLDDLLMFEKITLQRIFRTTSSPADFAFEEIPRFKIVNPPNEYASGNEIPEETIKEAQFLVKAVTKSEFNFRAGEGAFRGKKLKCALSTCKCSGRRDSEVFPKCCKNCVEWTIKATTGSSPSTPGKHGGHRLDLLIFAKEQGLEGMLSESEGTIKVFIRVIQFYLEEEKTADPHMIKVYRACLYGVVGLHEDVKTRPIESPSLFISALSAVLKVVFSCAIGSRRVDDDDPKGPQQMKHNFRCGGSGDVNFYEHLNMLVMDAKSCSDSLRQGFINDLASDMMGWMGLHSLQNKNYLERYVMTPPEDLRNNRFNEVDMEREVVMVPKRSPGGFVGNMYIPAGSVLHLTGAPGTNKTSSVVSKAFGLPNNPFEIVLPNVTAITAAASYASLKRKVGIRYYGAGSSIADNPTPSRASMHQGILSGPDPNVGVVFGTPYQIDKKSVTPVLSIEEGRDGEQGAMVDEWDTSPEIGHIVNIMATKPMGFCSATGSNLAKQIAPNTPITITAKGIYKVQRDDSGRVISRFGKSICETEEEMIRGGNYYSVYSHSSELVPLCLLDECEEVISLGECYDPHYLGFKRNCIVLNRGVDDVGSMVMCLRFLQVDAGVELIEQIPCLGPVLWVDETQSNYLKHLFNSSNPSTHMLLQNLNVFHHLHLSMMDDSLAYKIMTILESMAGPLFGRPYIPPIALSASQIYFKNEMDFKMTKMEEIVSRNSISPSYGVPIRLVDKTDTVPFYKLLQDYIRPMPKVVEGNRFELRFGFPHKNEILRLLTKGRVLIICTSVRRCSRIAQELKNFGFEKEYEPQIFHSLIDEIEEGRRERIVKNLKVDGFFPNLVVGTMNSCSTSTTFTNVTTVIMENKCRKFRPSKADWKMVACTENTAVQTLGRCSRDNNGGMGNLYIFENLREKIKAKSYLGPTVLSVLRDAQRDGTYHPSPPTQDHRNVSPLEIINICCSCSREDLKPIARFMILNVRVLLTYFIMAEYLVENHITPKEYSETLSGDDREAFEAGGMPGSFRKSQKGGNKDAFMRHSFFNEAPIKREASNRSKLEAFADGLFFSHITDMGFGRRGGDPQIRSFLKRYSKLFQRLANQELNPYALRMGGRRLTPMGLSLGGKSRDEIISRMIKMFLTIHMTKGITMGGYLNGALVNLMSESSAKLAGLILWLIAKQFFLDMTFGDDQIAIVGSTTKIADLLSEADLDFLAELGWNPYQGLTELIRMAWGTGTNQKKSMMTPRGGVCLEVYYYFKFVDDSPSTRKMPNFVGLVEKAGSTRAAMLFFTKPGDEVLLLKSLKARGNGRNVPIDSLPQAKHVLSPLTDESLEKVGKGGIETVGTYTGHASIAVIQGRYPDIATIVPRTELLDRQAKKGPSEIGSKGKNLQTRILTKKIYERMLNPDRGPPVDVLPLRGKAFRVLPAESAESLSTGFNSVVLALIPYRFSLSVYNSSPGYEHTVMKHYERLSKKRMDSQYLNYLYNVYPDRLREWEEKLGDPGEFIPQEREPEDLAEIKTSLMEMTIKRSVEVFFDPKDSLKSEVRIGTYPLHEGHTSLDKDIYNMVSHLERTTIGQILKYKKDEKLLFKKDTYDRELEIEEARQIFQNGTEVKVDLRSMKKFLVFLTGNSEQDKTLLTDFARTGQIDVGVRISTSSEDNLTRAAHRNLNRYYSLRKI